VETSTENVTYDRQQNENQRILDDYIEARKIENNIPKNFQRLIIRTVNYLTKYTNKNLKDITRDDIVSFLNSVRKSEAEDPSHRCIGTYNNLSYNLNHIFQMALLSTDGSKAKT
jgi:site-specific recombinase XerD